MGKGEIALNKQFLLFPWCFLSSGTNSFSLELFQSGTLSAWSVKEICFSFGKGLSILFVIKAELFILEKLKICGTGHQNLHNIMSGALVTTRPILY